jgi:BirA family biotin operon repressor/biotin-[acetyl-CoA-carboxylase] ligase
MAVKEEILLILQNQTGVYLSGEELAARLGVTRAAVWKAIRALRADGCHIDAATNRGYALVQSGDLLSGAGIAAQLGAEAENFKIEVHRQEDSTNKALRAMAQSGAPEGSVLFAEEQTAGRGRGGHSFFSPPGTGLYFSLLLRPRLAAADAPLLTTAAAMAAAQTVEVLTGRSTGIKWVNDVELDGKKICGILTEAALSVESGQLEYAVLGIGLNVYPPQGGFPPELDGRAACLFADSTPRPNFRCQLAAGILQRFMTFYRALPAHDFLSDYRQHLLFLGQPILVLQGETQRNATALDVDDAFHLLVRWADGSTAALSGGEIHVIVPRPL